MLKKAAAFLRLRNLPLANQVVFDRLQTRFSEHRLDLYDLSSLVKERPHLVAANLIPLARHYGVDIAVGRKKRHRAFWRTPFMFEQGKRSYLGLKAGLRLRYMQFLIVYDLFQNYLQ